MYNSVWHQRMSRIDDRQEALLEMSVVFHQMSLCTFKREFKFEMEYKIWRQKYIRHCLAIEIQII